jgi:uncharacterized protein (TIGR00251 family)
MVIKSSRFHNGRRGSALTIQVVPQSNENKLTNILEDGTLKIKIKAPLAGGEADKMLVDYLEMIFDVQKYQIEIIAGEKGVDKIIAILDVDPDEIQKRIMNYWSNV